MIKIVIEKTNGSPIRMKTEGHSGFEETGKDIVCAIVSTAVQGYFIGLCEISEKELKFSNNDGYFSFDIPKFDDEQKKYAAGILFKTTINVLKQAKEQFFDYLEITEV